MSETASGDVPVHSSPWWSLETLSSLNIPGRRNHCQDAVADQERVWESTLAEGSVRLLALLSWLRKIPKNDPAKSFVPDFVMTLITGPLDRPYSALGMSWITSNSPIPSWGKPWRYIPTRLSLLSAPSMEILRLCP